MTDSSFKTYRQSQNSKLESERLSRLKERVGTVQKKLQEVETFDRSARKIYSMLEMADSPVKLLKDVSNTSINMSMSKNMRGDLDGELSNLSISQNNFENLYSDPNQIEITNNRTKILKEILLRMDMFRNNTPNTQKILNYFNQKIESNKPFYYNFLKENNSLTLKALVQILYEEVENLANSVEQSDMTNGHYIEQIEKKLEEKTILCNKFTEEIVEKNMEIESLQKRLAGGDDTVAQKYSLLFCDLNILFQNLKEEIFSPDAELNEEKLINYKHMVNSAINQLKKAENNINSGNSGAGHNSSTAGFYHNNSQDMPRLYSVDDRPSNFMQTGFSRKYDSFDANFAGNNTQQQGGNGGNFGDFLNNQGAGGLQTRREDVSSLMHQISSLESENKKLKNKIDEFRNSTDSSKENSHLLMNELKRVMSEKEQLDEENKKLRHQYQESREEFANLSSHLLKNTTERESQSKSASQENEQIRKKLQNNVEEMRKMEDHYKKEIHELESDLKKTRERVVILLDEKSQIEKEIFQLKAEKKETTTRNHLAESKMDELQTQREGLLNKMQALEQDLESLEYEKKQLCQENESLRQSIAISQRERQNNDKTAQKQMEELEEEINVLKRDLISASESLTETRENLIKSEEEKKQLESKCEEMSNFDSNKANEFMMEQLSMIILSKTGKNVDPEVKTKIQHIFGDNFVKILDPLQKKLKYYQTYKQKYQELLKKNVDKLDDVKWLSNLLLQAVEVMARSGNNQIPATLIMLKEELEQKKNLVSQKMKDATSEQESRKQELKDLIQQGDEDLNSEEILSPQFKGGRNNDDLRDENETLKNKLQTQSYEIQSLKSQLKLASTLDETKKTGRENSLNRSNRFKKEASKNKLPNPSISVFDEEEEQTKISNEIQSQNDLLLLLHSQASSLEMLINSEY